MPPAKWPPIIALFAFLLKFLKPFCEILPLTLRICDIRLLVAQSPFRLLEFSPYPLQLLGKLRDGSVVEPLF